MNTGLSDNTKAILLLTAPLQMGKAESTVHPLTARDYGRLAESLIVHGHQPSDLLTPQLGQVLDECLPSDINKERINQLLRRGVLLSLTLEHWQARAIWVISRADPDYPKFYKKHMQQNTPPILYGCGDISLLQNDKLAVVGSRKISDTLTEYAKHIGNLAAKAQCTVVSGGATGVDQAAVQGVLAGGGTAVVVLPANLETEALSRKYRNALLDGRLALVSQHDPKTRWTIGRAMERNKLIYALSNAALVVESSYKEGGTWPGAVEQLDKLNFVPVYTRSEGEISVGLKGLQQKGALPWPNPQTPADLRTVLSGEQLSSKSDASKQEFLFTNATTVTAFEQHDATTQITLPQPLSEVTEMPASDILFVTFEKLIEDIGSQITVSEVADHLKIEKKQATNWLKRLTDEGKYTRVGRSMKYTRNNRIL